MGNLFIQTEKRKIPCPHCHRGIIWVTDGRWLRMARLRAGLTLDQLSRKSGVPASLISMVENLVREPTPKTDQKLRRALGLHEREFEP